MSGNFKKKLACLLFVIVFTFTTVAGCGNSGDELKEKLTDNNVTESFGEQTTADDEQSGDVTDNDDESSSNTGDSEDESPGETSNSTSTYENGESDSETTSVNTTGESKSDDSASSNDTETTSKKQETTTTKKQESTTNKKQETTTKKQETTTEKATEQETTTKKQTSSIGSSSSGSTLSTAEQMAKEIVDSIITSGMSDFQKAITIHDWLTYNLDYDFTYSHYYVGETLRDRTCVCQGYALTFKMMCEMVGLDVGYVTGTGTNSSGDTESHAWNQVKIDGQWYNVDVTWDDPASPGKDKNDHSANRYDYFLISDSRIEQNHTTTVSRQTCPSDYDAKAILKHAANSGVNEDVAYAENVTDFAAAVQKFYSAGKTYMILWYYDTTVTSDSMWNVLFNTLLPAAPVAVTHNPSYPPENGVTKYILTIPSKSEWNGIPVVTSSTALADLINKNFAAGTTTFTARFEPTDGVIQFAGTQYSFSYVPTYYNNSKSVLLKITPPQS